MGDCTSTSTSTSTGTPRSSSEPLYKLLGISKSGSYKDLYKSLVKGYQLDHSGPESKKDEEERCVVIRKTNDAATKIMNDEKDLEKFVEPATQSVGFFLRPLVILKNLSRKRIASPASKNSTKPTRMNNSSPTIARNPSLTGIDTPTSSTSTSSSPCTSYTVRRSPSRMVFTTSVLDTITKPPPVEMRLDCTLEELYRGRVKRVRIVRDVIKNGVFVQEEETIKIKLVPGWKSGTKITFEGKGDANKLGCLIPCDVVLVIREKPHDLFTREGDNLVYNVQIPLTDALAGCTLSVPMLARDNMWLSFADEVISPDYEKVIRGQGMPIPNENGKKGDFVIRFSIAFPTGLSLEQRRRACEILQDCC